MKKFTKIIPALLIFILGVSISFWIHFAQQKKQFTQKENEILLVIEDIFNNIHRELTTGFSSVEILRYLFEKNEAITKDEFQNYTKTLIKRNPGIKALSWCPKISNERRAEYEFEITKDLQYDFTITTLSEKNEIIPRGENSFYFPVHYIEPFNENINAIGYDIYSNIDRKDAIDLAIKDGGIIITSGIKLIQDSTGYSILGITPVFFTPEKTNNKDQTKGLISAVFKVEKLIKDALEVNLNTTIDIVVTDITDEQYQVIYGDEEQLNNPISIVKKKELSIGGRIWELNFMVDPSLYKIDGSWMSFWIGVLISIVFFIILSLPFLKEKRNQILSERLSEEKKERKETELSLTESEAYNRLLFSQTTIGLALTRLDGTLIDVNPGFAKIIGRSVKETLHLTYWEITPEKYLQQEEVQLKNLKETGSYGPYEKEYIHKNGNLIPVRLQGKIITQKGIDYIWSSVEDITIQKLAEEKMKMSENKYKALIEQSITGIYIFEKDKFLYVNKRFAEIFGYSENEILANFKPTDVVKPDERPKAQENINKRLEGDVDSVHYIARGMHKTEKEMWIEIHGTHIHLDGKEVITGTVLDITERVLSEKLLSESENQFRAAFEQSASGMCMTDLKGFIKKVNTPFCNMLGYSKSEMEGMHFDSITYKVDLDVGREFVQKMIQGKIKSGNFEKRYLKKSGEIIWTNINSSLILNAEGQPIHFITQIENITQRKLIEEKLKESEEKYRLLFNLAPDSLVVTQNGRISDVNNVSLELFGIESNSEIIGTNPMIWVDPEYFPSTKSRLDNLYKQQGRQPSAEYRVLRKNGDKRDVEARSASMIDSFGTVTLAVLRDITLRKQSEKEILASKANLEAALKSMNDAVFISDIKGVFTHFNDAFASFHKFKDKEECAKTFSEYPEILDVLTLNDELVPVSQWAVPRALKGETINNVEFKLRRKDTGETWIGNYNFAPILNSEGSIVGSVVTARDITARKQAEKELQESEELLRLSMEIANVAAWEYDYTNDNMTRSKNHDSLYGIKDLIAWDFNTFLYATHPDDRELCNRVIQESVAIGGPNKYKFDFRVVHPDQSIHWLMVVGHVIERNEAGSGIIVRGFLIDITDRKTAEEALRESETKFRSLFENSVDAIGVSKNGVHVFVNPSYIKLFGYSNSDEFAEMSITDLIAPHERARIIENVKNREKGKFALYSYETMGCRKDGSEFDMDVHVSEYKVNNENYTLVILRDITDKKRAEIAIRESEERFRKIFEEGSLGMAMVNFEGGNFTNVNQALCDMLGYTKEELKKLSFKDIIHPNYLNLDIQDVQDLYKDKIQKHQTEKKYIKKNGEAFWAMRSLSKIWNEDRKTFYAIAMIDDISKRKIAEEKIQELNETLEKRVEKRTAELESVNKELQAFTYSVSHDLKAPLRGIDGYSKLLLEAYSKDLNHEAQTFLNNIRSGTHQMNQLIEDLLTYSRLERTTFRNSKIDVQKMIDDMKINFQNEIKERNIHFQTDYQVDFIVTDYNGLSMAIRNLIENSIKFTKKIEKPSILIKFEANDSYWKIEVKDNGIGFNMKYHNQIFEIFQRLHHIEDYPGTGIGLALVQKAIHRMNGSVRAESAMDSGATFIIEIPKINHYEQ